MRSRGFQVFLPLSVLAILILINLIKGADYFSISIINGALYGNIPNILFGASELVILSIGMTLVTSSSGGQDISVGVAGAITSSVFVRLLLSSGGITWAAILAAFLASCAVGIAIGAFNGALVAVFKVQPMVATLILFTAGRSVAFLIDGRLSPILANDLTSQVGSVIPGVPIQTPIILTAVFIALFAVLLRTTNLKLYSQCVGINQKAARLNGINPVRIKFLTYMILGVCSAVAGFIAVTKAGRHDSVNLLKYVEMDAILAVAIGGNPLGGGTFSIAGSIIGAYTIEVLNRTLLRLEVDTETIKAFKAAFIIILMVIASPVVRQFAARGSRWMRDRLGGSAQAGQR
ncbi:MAG TPA: ABC transporter permease [Spirochaetales bacterium]|nr:ABC transporter permease [Spirochaetales bacterium]HRY53212.1 ABC transporter permease [Spirochaetia bacterium]HRZ64141.1 ABC transporter permease [Spirochaetia bacterium]